MNIRQMGSTYGNEWYPGLRFQQDRPTSPASVDPTIVSLTRAEFQRLLDIESAALTALNAMGTIPTCGKNISDAAEALDVALHTPIFGG